MCVQDQRVTSGLTLRRVSLGGASVVQLPDLSRAYMFYVLNASNTACPVYTGPAASPVEFVPGDTRWGLPDTSGGLGNPGVVYSRESIGPFVRSPLWAVDAAASGSMTLFIYEADRDAVSAFLQPLLS